MSEFDKRQDGRFEVKNSDKLTIEEYSDKTAKEARQAIAKILKKKHFGILPQKPKAGSLDGVDSEKKISGSVITDGISWTLAYYDETDNTGLIENVGDHVVFDMVTGKAVTGINPKWESNEYKVVGTALQKTKAENYNENGYCRIPVKLNPPRPEPKRYSHGIAAGNKLPEDRALVVWPLRIQSFSWGEEKDDIQYISGGYEESPDGNEPNGEDIAYYSHRYPSGFVETPGTSFSEPEEILVADPYALCCALKWDIVPITWEDTLGGYVVACEHGLTKEAIAYGDISPGDFQIDMTGPISSNLISSSPNGKAKIVQTGTNADNWMSVDVRFLFRQLCGPVESLYLHDRTSIVIKYMPIGRRSHNLNGKISAGEWGFGGAAGPNPGNSFGMDSYWMITQYGCSQ